jgi:kinesin family protein 6/9
MCKQDSLGGNCKTYMVANIWTEPTSIEETISTLKFATRMMRVSNEPVVNVTYDPAMLVKKYEREIKELKAELAMHDTLSNKSHVQYETYTETQRNELNASLRKYLAEEIDDIEVSPSFNLLYSLPCYSLIFLLLFFVAGN